MAACSQTAKPAIEYTQSYFQPMFKQTNYFQTFGNRGGSYNGWVTKELGGLLRNYVDDGWGDIAIILMLMMLMHAF